MEFLIIVAIIIIILVIRFNKTKKVENENKEIKKQNKEVVDKKTLFKEEIKDYLKSYKFSPKCVFFINFYEGYMGEAISKEMDEKLKDIANLKNKYRVSLKKLISISENNTVFFTTREENENFRKKYDYDMQENKISEDIIKTIPYFAEFMAIHRKLVIEIYNNYLFKICMLHLELWKGLYYTEEERKNATNKEIADLCFKRMYKVYRECIQKEGWKDFCIKYPQYNTEQDCNNYLQIFENMEYKDIWYNVWCECFDAMDKKHGHTQMLVDLNTFFDAVNEELGNPSWLKYPTEEFSFDVESSLYELEKPYECSAEELNRIRNLYISRQMSGEYTKAHDPKYKSKRDRV